MKILVASDSFKGSLTSGQVAETVASALPQHQVSSVIISDGGEGFCQAVHEAIGGEWHACLACDPLGRQMPDAPYLVKDGTAFIELATCSGLTLLSPSERNPMITTTWGTGMQIADAIRRGVRDFVIGLGGSATNDCATGLLSALGFRFRPDCRTGQSLRDVQQVGDTDVISHLRECRFRLASDVQAPLCGSTGAAHVFARQKGADDQQIEALEQGCQNFATLIRYATHKNIAVASGAGAAGGTGAGLMAFLDAEMVSGIDLMLDLQHFDERLSDTDLVITGEGRIDDQTLMGKAPYGIARRAKQHGCRCIAIAGSVNLSTPGPWDTCVAITPSTQPLSQALQPETARDNLTKALQSLSID